MSIVPSQARAKAQAIKAHAEAALKSNPGMPPAAAVQYRKAIHHASLALALPAPKPPQQTVEPPTGNPQVDGMFHRALTIGQHKPPLPTRRETPAPIAPPPDPPATAADQPAATL